MDVLSISAAAGMKARLEALDFVANNLANQSTPGFKAEKEQFSLYWNEAVGAAQDSEEGVVQTLLPVTEKRYTDLSQGELTRTDGEADLALSSSGFFKVLTPNGPMYTRNGHFVVSADGALTTAQGYGFAGEDGTPVTVTAGSPVSVQADGSVYQAGAARGKLALVDWPAETATTRVEGGYFALDSASTVQAHPATRK